MLKQKFSTFLNQQNWMLRHIYKRKKKHAAHTSCEGENKTKSKKKKNEKREKRELQQQLRRKEFV